ncbi:cysteine desulfurase family protein [Microterricola viridarii]|uniref:Cysteine desulfurase n=1 Tax=Microterricola viridarii TaxID=412690 RepID=A0A1H1TAM5_9MICO|nr:cysteine desulfurase family protein [Microterricola viridarii]SDS57307.1 cysteine desulfurase [Microterricola viridarii]
MAVYLDHAATTPMLPLAIDAYAHAMALVGNPASIHSIGQNAKRVLEEAREQVAATLGCESIEVVFTGGGTEAVNLAIKGLFWARPGTRILVAAGEHHATIDTVEWLAAREGATIQWLPLDEAGRLSLPDLEAALAEDPEDIALVSVLWANNEVGTVQPITEISALAARAGVPLHVDAIAAYGQLPIDVSAVRADSGAGAGTGLVALSVSAHKIGGPVGIGALVLSRSATIEALIHGGGQQRQVRSGTQDAAAAVSFAAAASAVHAALPAESVRLAALRDRLVAGALTAVPQAVLNGAGGDATVRLPGNAHFSFPGCEGDSLLFLLDMAGVAVSTGSACQAGIPEPSHVLIAMGRSVEEARGALRVTLGHTSTDADVDAFLAALPAAYAQAATAGHADRQTSFDLR